MGDSFFGVARYYFVLTRGDAHGVRLLLYLTLVGVC